MPDAAKAAPLAERLIAGDKRALARAITLIESDDPAGWALVREVYPRTGKARIVGFTGPPGVGKSTLIGALTGELRKEDRQVAVLSIDPSSPFTRGALLGDRIRLTEHFLDAGVFIRSMASRGALGGLSEAALQVEQEVHHLCLHRDVERRHGFVRDDQGWIQRERARESDALALTAAELVRKP
jgi:putative protein kinase ArgK-like GTPase of G3E family